MTLIGRAPRLSLAVFFAIAFGGMLIWGIKKEAAQIDFHLLVSALRATPTLSLAAALAATALSYLALVGYDVSGLRYARARAPLKTILLASFCGFAVGNCIGLGAFSGGAVRYRLYTAAGLLTWPNCARHPFHFNCFRRRAWCHCCTRPDPTR